MKSSMKLYSILGFKMLIQGEHGKRNDGVFLNFDKYAFEERLLAFISNNLLKYLPTTIILYTSVHYLLSCINYINGASHYCCYAS